jgi:hypothetical protein
MKTAFEPDDEDNRPRWKKDWSLSDHIMYSINRAGFYGRQELALEVVKPLTEGKVPDAIAELGGAVVSTGKRVATYGPSARNLPGGDLWGTWGS